MDLLESFLEESNLSIESVRDAIDDYSLISHYIGQELELGTRYSSPLREGDEDPSFSLFYGYGDKESDKLYFKDHASGDYGDVFDFLKIHFATENLKDILEKINSDLQLELGPYSESSLKPSFRKVSPVIKERAKLYKTAQPPTKEFMDYWYGKYEITRKYTDMYYAECVKYIHLKYLDSTKIIVPKTLCISYSIGDRYKFYQPFADKSDKFRNDFLQNYIEGHMQLDWSRNDLLLISKSLKEDILFRCHWDIQAVAGKSETTMIHPYFMQIYLKHFKRVVLWLDPDPAGIKMTAKYLELYPELEAALIPSGVTEKDPTDMFEVRRKIETTDLVRSILRI